MVELSDGRFFRHDGNYTDYLLAKAERQAADATIEHKRQMFLKKELAWVRQGPRAQRSKQKDRFERYYDTVAQDGPEVEEDVELCIPPPPPRAGKLEDEGICCDPLLPGTAEPGCCPCCPEPGTPPNGPPPG